MQRMHGYTTIYRQKEGGRMRQPQTTTMQQSAEERHDETTTTMQQSTDKTRKNHVMAVETATVSQSQQTTIMKYIALTRARTKKNSTINHDTARKSKWNPTTTKR